MVGRLDVGFLFYRQNFLIFLRLGLCCGICVDRNYWY